MRATSYIKYFRLGETSYREKVKYYEDNYDLVQHLYFDDKVDIDMDYIQSLFEIGRYDRFLSKVDTILEVIIMENIYEFKGENIFNDLLFKKAACLFHNGNYDEAKNVLRQLIKIDASNYTALALYKICKRKETSDFSVIIKAFVNASLLIVISIYIGRIFLIEAFFDQYMGFFVSLSYFLLGFSAFVFIGYEVYFNASMYKETGLSSFRVLNRVFYKKR